MFPGFGYTDEGMVEDYYTVLMNSVKKLGYKGLKGMAATIFLREEYEEYHKIVDFNDRSTSHHLVAVQPKDGLRELGPKYHRLHQWERYDIYKNHGWKFDEFIAQPRELVDYFIERARKSMEQEARIANRLKQDEEKKSRRGGRKGHR